VPLQMEQMPQQVYSSVDISLFIITFSKQIKSGLCPLY
jgi:hypothetical protein